MEGGKPWADSGRFDSYESADEFRTNLLNKWSQENLEGMQVKIRRRTNPERFVVKTRLHPDFEPKEEKKHGKNKRRNKKNSTRRKFDATSAV